MSRRGLAVRLRLKPARKTERSLTARSLSQSPATRVLDVSGGRRKSCFTRCNLVLRSCLSLAVLLALQATPATAQQTHIIVITGLSGDPAYAEEFHQWATTLIDAATDRYELPAENIIYLAEKTDVDPVRIEDRSTRENVERAFATVAERALPDDRVLVLLIGHGTYASGESRFNLPGRDLTAKDYARLLEPLGSQQVAFVNAATASGGFIEVLSGEDEARLTFLAVRRWFGWSAGRLAVFEMMVLDDLIREMIMSQASTALLRQESRKRGMRTLRESGLLSIYDGRTTIDEVLRETISEEA